MSKGSVDLDKSAEVWAELDSTAINNIGGRCFFTDKNLGKCVATVSGFPGERAPVERDANENIVGGGQILFWLTVQHNNGGADFKVKTYFSSDGKAGTARLAEDGDLADHVNLSKLKVDAGTPEVVEEVEAPATNTNQQGQPGQFEEADADKDGVVSPREQKKYDKGRRQ